MKKGFGIRTPFSLTGFTIRPQKPYAKEGKAVTHRKTGAEDVTLHHRNLMAAIRSNEPLRCDPLLGYCGVVACMLGVESFRKRRYLAWDKAKQRLVHA